MAYVGRVPTRGQNREIDDISSSFNGSTTAFTLQSGGLNTSPGSVNQLFVNLGGVMQNPGTDFTVSNYTITFTTAPASGLSFWALIQGDAIDINTPADDSVTGAKLAVSLVAGDTLYASGADTLARLPKGTDGQVLKLASGLPSWAADAQDSTLTTQGDILYRDGSGYARLAAGTSGYFLKTQGSGANPTWAEAGGAFTYNSTSESVYGLGTSGEDLTNASNQRCTLIGFAAGKEVTDGPGNTAVGAESLFKCTTGDYNTVVGHYSMATLTTGNHNIAMGNSAMSVGITTGDNNIAIGTNAANSLTSGYDNIYIGKDAGKAHTTGWHNVIIGLDAAESWVGGHSSVVVGKDAAKSGTGTGCRELVCVGQGAARDVTGANNTDSYGITAVGFEAGEDVTTHYEGCFLGRQAGKGQTMVSQELWLAHRDHNKGTASVWIHGTNAGACTQGNNSSSWTTTSDQRIKKNIVDNNVGLSAIEQLKVRNFEYRVQVETGKDDTGHTTWAPKSDSDVIDTSTLSTLSNGQKPKPHQVAINKEGTQIGMIAQEVEAVLPGCVETDANGIKSVDTDEMFWHMINSIKELSAKNKTLEADVTQLKTDNNSLVARVTALEAA